MTYNGINTIALDDTSDWSACFDQNASLGTMFTVQDKQLAIELIQRGMTRGCTEPFTSFHVQVGRDHINYVSLRSPSDFRKTVSHIMVRTQQNDKQTTSLFLTGSSIKLDAIRKAIKN